MFTQRTPYEPTISLKDSQTGSATGGDEKIDDQLNDGMNVSLKIRRRSQVPLISLSFSGYDCER